MRNKTEWIQVSRFIMQIGGGEWPQEKKKEKLIFRG